MKEFAALLLVIFLAGVRAVVYLEVERPSATHYLPSSEICCNGTIYENKTSSDYECCAGKLIELETEICCFPESYPRHGNSLCCKNQTYDPSTHHCEMMSTSHKSRQLEIRTERAVVLPLSVTREKSCGDKGFDITKEICCNYEIIPDPEQKLTCCGTEGGTYDPNTHACCEKEIGSTVVAKTSATDYACCNGESYNKATKICHNDALITRESDAIQLCKSGEVYNRNIEICCERPALSNVIQKSNQSHSLCCGNTSYSINDDQWFCCATFTDGKLYSKATAQTFQQCCGLQMITANQGCCGFQQPYNPATQTCCQAWNHSERNTIVKVHNKAHGQCCGAEVMGDEEECCGVKIIPKSPEGKSGCCTSVVHDLNEEPIRLLKRYKLHFT